MKHLTYDERLQIQKALTLKTSFAAIAQTLGKNRTTNDFLFCFTATHSRQIKRVGVSEITSTFVISCQKAVRLMICRKKMCM